MTSKQRVQSALAHRMPDCVPVDFRSNFSYRYPLQGRGGFEATLWIGPASCPSHRTFSDAGRDRE